MASTPAVTVLLATHNYERYLAGAINSVLNQTYPILQLCIIDDASEDKSWDIVERLFAQLDCKRGKINQKLDLLMAVDGQRKFTAIKIPQNVGPSEARNIGINVTLNETDIYAILDADDEMYPTKIEKCVNKLMMYPDVGVVYADYHILNMETGNLLYEYKWPFSRKKLLQECVVHSAALIKKDALLTVQENGYFYHPQLTCAEDYDLWLRLSEKCMISHIPEPLSLVRIHNQSSVNYRSNETWQRCWQFVAQRVKERNDKK